MKSSKEIFNIQIYDISFIPTVIIVEGEDDISFFNGKLSSNVDIRESFSGKRGVLEIVSLFSDSRVIGVCDVDYDTGTPSPQILYYDYSCLEMMLISSDSAFTPFFHTYYRGQSRLCRNTSQIIARIEMALLLSEVKLYFRLGNLL